MADLSRKNEKILVVDDIPNVRKTIRHMLRVIGYPNVTEASDGDKAYELLKAKQFDFVIADLYMPKVGGLELLQLIREDASLRDLPFMIITAYTDTGHIAKAAEEDVDGYIIKPFVAETLERKMKYITEKKADPPESEVHLKLGNVYMDSQMYEKALIEFEKAKKIKPGSARITHSIGKTYQSLGEIEKAEQYFTEAMSYNSKYIKVHQSLGELYLETGRQDEAIESLQKATAISPNNSARQMSLGKLYADNNQLEEADLAFQSAIKSDPKNAEIQTQIGEIYLEQGRAEKAADAFKSSLGLDENVHVYNRLGIALRRKHRYKEAIGEYKKALKVEPDNEAIYYNLGRALLEDSQRDAARDAFNKALDINPDFDEAKNMIAKIAPQTGAVTDAGGGARLR